MYTVDCISYGHERRNANYWCSESKPKGVATIWNETCTASLYNLFYMECAMLFSLQWRHNGRDGVRNQQRLQCLFSRLFRRKSTKTSKLRVTGFCEGNSPVTGEFPLQSASNRKCFHFMMSSCSILGLLQYRIYFRNTSYTQLSRNLVCAQLISHWPNHFKILRKDYLKVIWQEKWRVIDEWNVARFEFYMTFGGTADIATVPWYLYIFVDDTTRQEYDRCYLLCHINDHSRAVLLT